MKTTTANKVHKSSTVKRNRKSETPSVAVAGYINRQEPGTETVIRISLSDLDASPFNYRRHFHQESLEELALTIKDSGVLFPIIVRVVIPGRYEIVAGERRYKGSIIAGEKDIPAYVRNLTDKEVKAIQLIENCQRENPHPMEEAHAIHNMQLEGTNIKEIAAILGKDKKFVYSRLKLMELIPEIQEIVAADKMTLVTALEVGQLAQESQKELFDKLLTNWKEQDCIELSDYDLRPYRYDLTRASFDTRCKKLIPEAGACTNCPFNSATLHSLFPDTEKGQTCSNKKCYYDKTVAGFIRTVDGVAATHTPAALITRTTLPAYQKEAIQQHPVYGDLPVHQCADISLIQAPEQPDREDYTYDPEEEDGEPEFDQETYDTVMMEYETDKAEYETQIAQEGVYRALLFHHTGIAAVYFSHEKPVATYTHPGNERKVTAREVTEALKEGTATAELLQIEIKRLQDREERAKEIDQEKIHAKIYQRAKEWIEAPPDIMEYSEADEEAIRFILLNTLSYNVKYLLEQYINRKSPEGTDLFTQEMLGQTLRTLPEKVWVQMIRRAILDCNGAGLVSSEVAPFIRGCAAAMDIDIAAMEAEQAELTKVREDRVNERITVLKAKISKMNPTV